MRHPVRRLGRLDKEFAHAPDVMPLRVVSLRPHEFCCVKFHSHPLLVRALAAAGLVALPEPGANKKPAHRRTSAAGKYLIQMDLPLAASGPSPPDRSRPGLRLARYRLDTQLIYQPLAPCWPGTARARFEFATRAHRERIHSVAVTAVR